MVKNSPAFRRGKAHQLPSALKFALTDPETVWSQSKDPSTGSTTRRNKLSCPLLDNDGRTERERQERFAAPGWSTCLVWQGQAPKSKPCLSLSSVIPLFNLRLWCPLTCREKGSVLHGSDKLPSKNHIPQASSIHRGQDDGPVTAKWPNERDRVEAEFSFHMSLNTVFTSITESKVDSMCVKMCVHLYVQAHSRHSSLPN